MKLIGKNLKMRRITLDLTQKDLAEACNIAIGTISGIEKHSKSTSTKTLLEIAKFLKVDISYFFGE